MTQTLTGAAPRFARGKREIASGTWAWLQPNGGLGESNAGLIVGDGASMLIDTLWDHRLTATMLAAMRSELEGAPLNRVLNTHSDGDHWWGNKVVPDDAEIVCSERTARAMRHDVSPRELAMLTLALRAGGRLPGRLGRGLREGHARFAAFDFAGVRQRLPDSTFGEHASFDVAGRSVQAIVVGPAHSAGDTVVHVSDVDVVFAADVLFVGATPIMWAGPVENWIAAVDLLLNLDAETYVPGHGDLGRRADVERVGAYWTWLREQADEYHRLEYPRGAAARAILANRDFAWRDWDEPERIVANVDALYRGFDGRDPIGPRGPARMALMRDIATLGLELQR